jgi:signal transduction histidine kinase
VLVSDAGPGIADPAAAMARGNSGARDGSTGLGLDIVRRVAESTGGDVRIGRSVLGGTEVRIWIGLDPREAARGRRRGGHRGRVQRRRKAALR